MLPIIDRLLPIILSTVFVLTVHADGARAKDEIVTEIETAKTILSGPRERVWIAETVVAALSGNSCERGIRYRFRLDQTMAKESCIDGIWVIADGSWALSNDENGLLVLTLGEMHYTATMVRRTDSLEFTILNLPVEKTANTVEIVLRYLLD